METVVGVVSRVNRGSSVQGMMVGGRGTIQSHNALTFSVGKQPIEYRSKGTTSVEEGDQVVAAGPRLKNGLVRAYAIKNLENGLIMSEGGGSLMATGILCIAAGISVIGLPLVPLGIYLLVMSNKVKAAFKIVSSTQAPL